MALYQNGSLLSQKKDAAFDATHAPGATAPHAGIYRCTNCGDEIAIAGGHTLPPQNHKQHNPTTERFRGNCWSAPFRRKRESKEDQGNFFPRALAFSTLRALMIHCF
jgi:hypothetical protein